MSQFSSKEEVIQVRNFILPTAIQNDSFKIKQVLIFDHHSSVFSVNVFKNILFTQFNRIIKNQIVFKIFLLF